MSYAIFRVAGIKTTGDLKGIGKHNLERVSHTNQDIDLDRSSKNIHLVTPPNSETYMKRYLEIVEPMKLEHEEKMKTERKDRVKSFETKINSSKSDVACEFLFTSDEKFFEGMNKDQVKKWSETCLEFVKKEIGISEDKMLHAVVHMDEKTPHLHVVAVPLVKKFDGRAKRDVWQLNRKHFIHGKDHLSELQDKYYEHMLKHGYDLERGIKGSDSRHVNPEKFKVQEEMKKLEIEHEALKTDVKDLLHGVQVAKKIDEIQFEEKKALIGGAKTVKLASEDFEYIKALAKVSEGLKTEDKRLKIEIRDLKEENIILKKEKEQLKNEKRNLVTKTINLEDQNEQLQKQINSLNRYLKYLERIIERVKLFAERFIGTKTEEMQKLIGVIRVGTLQEFYGKSATAKKSLENTVPKDEQKYAFEYAESLSRDGKAAEQKSSYEKEQSKTRTRDNDRGMER